MTYEELIRLQDKVRDYNAYDFKVMALTNAIKNFDTESLKISSPNIHNIMENLLEDDQKLIVNLLTESINRAIENYNRIMEKM